MKAFENLIYRIVGKSRRGNLSLKRQHPQEENDFLINIDTSFLKCACAWNDAGRFAQRFENCLISNREGLGTSL